MTSPAGDALDAALAVWRDLGSRGFASFDPYDGPSARYLRPLVGASGMARRGVTQIVRRTPVPLERGIGVCPAVSAYTLGHAMATCARLYRAGALPDAASHAAELRLALTQRALHAWPGVSWGYHFAVHTRFFHYPASMPNAIVTSYALKGLAELTAAGLADCRNELAEGARFLLDGLPRVKDESGCCFGYLPSSSIVIHNANMLVALALVRAGIALADDALLDLAADAARFTCARQRDDGAWEYSEQEDGRWVDGYHTGFLLEGLAAVRLVRPAAELDAAFESGMGYYLAHLFGPGGEPRYYADGGPPYDALSAAQGLETLALLPVTRGGEAVSETLRALLGWIQRRLLRPDGRVAYQAHAHWTDARVFARWSSAPMAAALAAVALGDTPTGGDR